MRQRSFIVLAVALAVLVVGAVGVYAYDKSRDDIIAKGVTAGGVDLSGMNANEARDTLRRELAAPSRSRSSSSTPDHRYKLSPARAKVRVNTADMVQQALDASRTGNLITRTARAITGGSVHKSIKVEVSYSGRAVALFTKDIQKHIDQKPVDATISIGASGVSKVDSKDGRKLDVEGLKTDVAAELVEPTADHKVDAPVEHLKAKVTTADLAKKYPTVMIINRGGFQLTLYKNLQVAKTYRIAVGRQGLETPAGQYNIQDKQVNPSWHVPNSAWAGSLAGKVIPPGPADPIKARWMGIAGGAGIHGTDGRRLARHRGVARLHPDGDPGRDRACSTGSRSATRFSSRSRLAFISAGRRQRSTRQPAADLAGRIRGPPPSPSRAERHANGVSNAERAYEDAALLLPHHRVPERRRVAVAPDREPRPRRQVGLADPPGLD